MSAGGSSFRASFAPASRGRGGEYQPLPVRPARPQPRNRTWNKTSIPGIDLLNRAMQKLHLSIDYHSIALRPPARLTKDIVLADGLAYVYRLSKGYPLDRTRTLGTDEVVRRLTGLIPGPHFVASGVPAAALPLLPTGGFTPSHLQFLGAAATYIADLVVKNTGGKTKGLLREDTDTSVPAQPSQFEANKTEGETRTALGNQDIIQPRTEQDAAGAETEPLTEKALRKMERWCDLWLEGDLRDDDWETFRDCLDIPD